MVYMYIKQRMKTSEQLKSLECDTGKARQKSIRAHVSFFPFHNPRAIRRKGLCIRLCPVIYCLENRSGRRTETLLHTHRPFEILCPANLFFQHTVKNIELLEFISHCNHSKKQFLQLKK